MIATFRPRAHSPRANAESRARFSWRKWAERRRDRQRRLNARRAAAAPAAEKVVAPVAAE